MRGWRALGLFWSAVIVSGAASIAALQIVGPPGSVESAAALASVPQAAAVTEQRHAPQAAEPSVKQASSVTPTPVTSKSAPPAPDIREQAPFRAFARATDPTDKRPKLALLVIGVGLSESDSRLAIDTLPPAVTMGVSPYAYEPEVVTAAARARGHEYVVTLPMESQGYPLNDSGPRALLSGAEPADNTRNLEWVLSRIDGAVGVTGASDGLRGERFASAPHLIGPVLETLDKKGLMYIDPRPDAVVSGTAVAVTTILDDPPVRASVQNRLAELEQRARDGKPALGLAGPLRPAIVEQIANWARGLDGRGVDLVPVSSLVSATARLENH